MLGNVDFHKLTLKLSWKKNDNWTTMIRTLSLCWLNQKVVRNSFKMHENEAILLKHSHLCSLKKEKVTYREDESRTFSGKFIAVNAPKY